MNDRTIISYAYKGFTYLPLFLAHDLGYFPQGVDLHYADGDEEALRAVLDLRNKDNVKSHFAICDPLIIANLPALIGQREIGEPQIPVVVGSLIRRTPIWIFNTNPKVRPVAREADLRGLVHKVRCYQSPNTGYIIGRRLLETLGLPHDQTHFAEVDFDGEFNTPLEEDEILVTSDILRMGEVGYNNNNIVFSYASKVTDIREIFFTGIITSEELFSSDLSLVLAVLSGLKKAIERITRDEIDSVTALAFSSLKRKMIEHAFSPFNTTDEDAQKSIVKAAIEGIIRQESLYSPNLEVRKEDWDKSIGMRRGVFPDWQAPSYEAFTQDIPVILIQSDWKSRIVKKELCLGPIISTPRPPLLQWYHRWTPRVGLLLNVGFLVFFVMEFIDAIGQAQQQSLAKNWILLLLLSAFLIAGFGCFWELTRRIWNSKVANYSDLLTYWLGLTGAAVGLCQLFKSTNVIGN
jgi:hypothetical protein